MLRRPAACASSSPCSPACPWCISRSRLQVMSCGRSRVEDPTSVKVDACRLTPMRGGSAQVAPGFVTQRSRRALMMRLLSRAGPKGRHSAEHVMRPWNAKHGKKGIISSAAWFPACKPSAVPRYERHANVSRDAPDATFSPPPLLRTPTSRLVRHRVHDLPARIAVPSPKVRAKRLRESVPRTGGYGAAPVVLVRLQT